MRWQGEIADSERGVRRLFIVQDASRKTDDGKPFFWGVSERAGLAELRRVPNGSKVYVACRGRSKTGTLIRGREVFKLEIVVYADKLADRPVPFTPISQARAAGIDDVPPPGDDDVPF